MLDPRRGSALYRTAELLARSNNGASDLDLLKRFTHDHNPAAFTELLARHGPAIWAVCRRVTRNHADAEDVFQATFLVLARQAARVRKGASVGSWLYGVALRIGRKVRAKGDRVPVPARLTLPSASPDPAVALSWNEVRAALDEELARLPDALRAVVLLCYFQGMTQDEAAAELGWPARTVKARVARARDLLRARLTRRGIELSAALAVPLLTAELLPAVPGHLHTALMSSAASLALGGPPGADVSSVAVALARTEVPAVSLLRLVVLVTTAAGLLAAGSLIGRSADPAPERVARVEPAAPPSAESAPNLPATGVRIGTKEFRQVGRHTRVFFTDGGKTLMAAGDGVSIRFWDVQRGEMVHEITFKGNYDDAAATPDGSLLAVVGTRWPKGDDVPSEQVLWLIDAAARKVRHSIGLPESLGGNHQKVCVSDDGKRVVVEHEGDVRVFDAKSGEELMRHKGRINAGTLAFSRDGKLIAFGRFDLYLWKWDSGEEPRKFASITGFGTETSGFTPDGKALLTVSSGGRVVSFDVATGRQTATLDLGGRPRKWSFSPDGRTLAVVLTETTETKAPHAVTLWDLSTGKPVGQFPIGHAAASHVSWSADGARLAAATDARLWAWDVATQKPLGPNSPGHEGQLNALAFGPNDRLYVASADHTVRSWDSMTGKLGLELIHKSWVCDVAASSGGSLVAGSALDDDLRIWDAKSGVERFRLPSGRRVRFTPDDKQLIAWGDDLFLRVWDMRTGKLRAEHRTLPDGMTEAQLDDERSRSLLMIAFTPADISADGSTFAFCLHKIVQFFDVDSGQERLKFEIDPNGVMSLALSPDGKRMIVGGRGKPTVTRLTNGMTRHSPAKQHRTALWDVAAKKVVWETTSPGVWSVEVRFSPDGKRAAELVSYEDEEKHAVRIWDAESGKELGRIELPSRAFHFAFDRTGKRLAVAHSDTTAACYDLETALKPANDNK